MEQLVIRRLEICDYSRIYSQMLGFSEQRSGDTCDEFWCLQHTPVFTLGLGGKQEHILSAGNIPVIKTDRGGQVTYHGPGQLLVYFMLNLQRQGLSVRQLVYRLEQAVIDLCYGLNIVAERQQGAPGVYVEGKKLAALGIRVRRGYCYHGLALNVNMDLAPFEQINPCGYPGLQVTQLSKLGCRKGVEEVFTMLLPHLLELLHYNNHRLVKTAEPSNVSNQAA